VVTSLFANYYKAYIHKCYLYTIPFEKQFGYLAYGWDETARDNPTPHKYSWVELSLFDPRPKDKETKIFALADWGVIKVNIGIMTPILSDLKRAIK
jgi:hypothetical protein